MSAWMLYAAVVAALFAVAAWVAERGVLLYGRPTRMLWIGAMGASVGMPVIANLLPNAPPPEFAVSQPIVISGVAAIERVGRATVSLDAVLGLLWLAMSLALVAWLVWSVVRLRREQATWTRDVLDGTEVFVSPDVGPAVVDPIQGAIVVPRWLLDLAPDARRLALAHEKSHVSAGDARLVWLGMLLVVAMPWNPLLWWQLQRLRAAVELDCDRRVLAGGAVRKVYAELLVEVGSGRGASLLRPALIEPRSLLGWRINAMIEKRVRARLARTVIYGSLAAGIVFVACDAPAPQIPDAEIGEPEQMMDRRFDPAAYEGALAESDVQETPERLSCPPIEYPRMLQQAGIEGTVKTRFVIDAEGAVVPNSITITESDHRAFEGPVKDMLGRCRFRAGRHEGEAVRVAVEMPINFSLGRRGSQLEGLNIRGMTRAGDSVTMILRDGTPRVVAPPLYILDGVIVGPDVALSVDSLDIYSIEVVKGAAAKERWGDRAGNGVIAITTKKT